MHCFKDIINNRKYFLHFIRLLLPPKSPILPNLGGDPYHKPQEMTCTYTKKKYFFSPNIVEAHLKGI